MIAKARRWWTVFPLPTGYPILNWVLLAVPLAVFVNYFVAAGPLVRFGTSALAIIPLAGALGKATEDLAEHLGERAGGFLNATMGNATELIIAFLALRAGQEEIVKASLAGSIIGNTLLVLGMSALVGGIGREKQTFSRTTIGLNTTMLFIAVVALIIPAVFELAMFGQLRQHTPTIERFSLWTSAVLIVIYGLSVVFTFRTPAASRSHDAAKASVDRSILASVIALAVATVLVSWMSDLMVGQIEAAKRILGWSDAFIGVVIVATVGNAAEHSTAIFMARRNKMELALSIAAGSGAQIALLVAPLLVFAGWLMGTRLELVFSPLEIAGITVAVLILDMIAADGESTWFEGAELIAVYLILAAAFFFVPAKA